MFGQTASSGNLFGGGTSTNTTTGGSSLFAGGTSPSNSGLFGAQQNQKPSGSNLFGGPTSNTSTSSTSLFGSSGNQNAPFGSNTASNTGTGTFGSTNPQNTGSLFGASNTGTAGSLFGSSNTGNAGSLFGSSNTGNTGSLFGSSNTGNAGSLFASSNAPTSKSAFGSSTSTTINPFGSTSGNTGSTFGTIGQPQGGSIFGSPGLATNTNAFGASSNLSQPSSAWSYGAGTSTVFQNQPLGQYFSGALPLLAYAEASDLRFGNIPDGAQNDQNACMRNGIIPEPLRTQILQQEKRKREQGMKLSEIVNENTDELQELLKQREKMDQSVSALRSVIEQQRNAVNILVSEAKTCGRVAEKALHEARRFNNTSNVHVINKPIPSDFFWRLLSLIEARVEEFEKKSNELYSILYTQSSDMQQEDRHVSVYANQFGVKTIIKTLQRQHQSFQAIASLVAQVHEKMDTLREQYHDWIVDLTGNPPKDFQQEDVAELERQRRLLRKIEESAQGVNLNNLLANQNQLSKPTSDAVNTSNTKLFGKNIQSQSNAIPTNIPQGNFQNISTSTGANTNTSSPFGTNVQQGSSIFNKTSGDSGSSNLFSSTSSNLTSAPRKNTRSKRSQSRYR